MRNPLHILLVEDDSLQSELMRENLALALSNVRIDVIDTEYGFRSSFDHIVRNPPDVVILDIILRWTDPAPEMPSMPPEVEIEGSYRAGFRCQRLLAENPMTRNIPIIIYTILEARDMKSRIDESTEKNVHYVTKGSDLSPLIELILTVTGE